jgi:hypothetical protein
LPDRAYETVLRDTPAARATSSIVAISSALRRTSGDCLSNRFDGK